MPSAKFSALVLAALFAFGGPSGAESVPSTDAVDQLASLFRTEHQALTQSPPSLLRKEQPVSGANGSIYDRDYLAALPEARGDAQFQCLTEALYHEARGETIKGQFAVAEAILNRVESARYPNTVCNVVRQGAERRNACQFSYACDGRSDAMTNAKARDIAAKIARLMLDGAPRDLTKGATHFHTTRVKPKWSRVYPRTAQIGAHVFYRKPGAVLTAALKNP